MKPLDLPFNVALLQLTPELTRTMRPVTVLDYFENANGDFHEDGLFSVGIFGRVGDEARDRRFSYIDIKVEVFHPVIYKRLIQLRGLYRGIMAGTHYATWDEKAGDFSPADELSGETGFAFFMRHWRDIKFARNRSDVRELRIKLIEKYKDRATVNKILVMPAGMRDMEVDQSGNRKQSDINDIYRAILAISRTIAVTDTNANAATLDVSRHLLQTRFNELYDYVENMLTGKRGFVQGKWASRRIFDGTRNVITAMDASTEVLGGINSPRFTDTVVGLRQLSRALLPVTVNFLKTGYLSEVFAFGDGQARVVDPQTLKSEVVSISTEAYDRWNTVEGLEKVVSSYGESSLRDKPIILDGRYLALIYAGPEKGFRIFSDIDELPEHLDRKYVKPINLVELLYLSGYRRWNTYMGFVTRYPVTGIGSCYPSTLYVKTTVEGEVRQELGPDWTPLGEGYTAAEYPTYEPLAYLDSLVVPSTRLAGLGGDFDGDTASLNVVYTDEAVAEVKKYLTTRSAFVQPDGNLKAGVDTATIRLVLRNMTGDPE